MIERNRSDLVALLQERFLVPNSWFLTMNREPLWRGEAVSGVGGRPDSPSLVTEATPGARPLLARAVRRPSEEDEGPPGKQNEAEAREEDGYGWISPEDGQPR